MKQAKDTRAEEGGAGDGQYPGPNNASRNAPADGRKPPRSSDANNGPGDGVRGADGNAEVRGAGEGKRSRGFGGQTAEGGQLGDALPHCFYNAPAASHGAAAHGEVATNDDPVRNVERREQTARGQRGGDDTHAFLRVVGAVAQAVSRRGKELQAAKPAVHFERTLLANDPTGSDRDRHGDAHADERSEKNEQNGFGPAANNDGLKTRVGHGGAAIAAHESVRRAGGQAKNEGDEVPENGSQQPGQQDLLVHHLDVHHAFANGLGDGRAEHKSGDEIPECGPGHGAERRKHASGNNRGNGVGGVVPAIGELEDQGEDYDRDEKVEARHGRVLKTKEPKKLRQARELGQRAFGRILDVGMRVKRF